MRCSLSCVERSALKRMRVVLKGVSTSHVNRVKGVDPNVWKAEQTFQSAFQTAFSNNLYQHIHRIECYYLLYHLAKLLQKIIASQKNQHTHRTHATIFCNHLAKLLVRRLTARATCNYNMRCTI